jgi:cation transport ATPase
MTVTNRHETNGRNETRLERCDRNLAELLQEVRVVQTGVQVLFAFLLTVPFSAGFRTVTSFQTHVYFATLLVTAAAAVLLIAPTSWHRMLFRRGDKEHLVRIANLCALGGLACVAVSIVGVVLLVSDVLFGSATMVIAGTAAGAACALSWFVLPALRRRQIAS